jgi:hypothetical protein
MTLSIKTFGMMPLSILGAFATLSKNDTQHKALCIDCHYAESRILFVYRLNVVMLSVIIPNVVMVSVIMLCLVLIN